MDHALQKKIAIAEELINCANDISGKSKTAFPRKRILNHKDNNHRLRRQKKKLSLAGIAMSLFSTRNRVAIIAATPMPRFPSGSKSGLIAGKVESESN